jgi:drug/metabolite transporter (DMT)-like permease
MALVRCSLASALLVALLLRASGEPLRGLGARALGPFLFLGVTGYWLSTQFSYLGYHYTSAANAVILQAATPVMVAFGARLYLGERLTRQQQLGAAVSVVRVLFIVTNGRLALLRPDEMRAGDVITLGALTGWAAYTVYGKRVLAHYSPALATTAAYVLGTLLMVPTALLAAPHFPAPRLASAVAWSVVVYQAVVGALAHVWWYRAIQVVGPSIAAMFVNLQPVVGVLLAWLIAGETINVWQVVGGALGATPRLARWPDVRRPRTSGQPYGSADLLHLGEDPVGVGQLPLAVPLDESHDALRVDDERRADVRVPVGPVDAVVLGDGAMHVGEQRVVLDADRLGPVLVAEGAVRGDTQHLGIGRLEVAYALVEGGHALASAGRPVQRIEEQDDALAPVVVQADLP